MADDKKISGIHRVQMENRERLYISAVNDVLSFDEEIIVCDTDSGLMEIRGEDLHVLKLNLDECELSVSGFIEQIIYMEQNAFSKSKGSVLSKIFK